MGSSLIVACFVCVACRGAGGDGDSSDSTQTTSGASTDTSTSTGSTNTSSTDSSATDTSAETDTGTDTGGPEGNLLLSDQILNIAHRGGRVDRPEATLLAFAYADEVGADVLEFDLQASSDGVIVVMHDDTVDRTTDGTGPVKDMTFDELRSLDAAYDFSPDGGQTFPYRGMGVQIPTPQEIFDAHPDHYYLMEIKQAEPSIVATVLDMIADYGIEERVVLASFQQATIDEVRTGNPALFTAMSAPEMVEFASMGADPNYEPPCLFVQPPWEAIDQQLVDNAHARSLKVHPWTVNNETVMLDMIGYGVDGIMSDDPVLLESVLGG